MKNLKYVALSLLVVLLFNSVSYSQMKDRGNRDNMREMIKNKLQLTPEQEKKITELKLQHQENLIDLTSALKKKELQKEKILSGDVIQRNDMINVTKEIEEIRGKIALERINHQMDVYDQLDAKQKEIWKDMQLKKDKMKMRIKDGIKDRMNDCMKDKMQEPGNE